MNPPFRLIVGLGNPPSRYDRTRHNIGRRFVEFVAGKTQSNFEKIRRAEVIRLPDFFGVPLRSPVDFARLTTYMNESGSAVQGLLMKKNVRPEEMIVVVDDFMLPFGSLRLRAKGSSGGHNGLQSIINTVGSDRFGRLRIGIGPVPPGEDPADFVLTSFTQEESKKISLVFDAVQHGLETLFSSGYQRAMDMTNKDHLNGAKTG